MDIKNIKKFRITLRKLERELENVLKFGCKCCQVSLVQCHTLMELEKTGETTVKDLSNAMNLDKSTISRGINSLVLKGLVDRKTNPDNRRSVQLSLTAEGLKICKNINKMSDSFYSDIFNKIAPSKHKEVWLGLDLFSDALLKYRLESKNNIWDSDCSVINFSSEKK